MNNIEDISDIQAEAGVIATLMYRPDFILHSDYLEAGYFYNKDNGCFYWAIQQLYRSGIDNIDAFNISNMLSSNTAVKKTLDAYNLPSLQEYIIMCKDIARGTLEEYQMLVNKVLELAYKRDLYKKTLQIQNDCFNKDIPLKILNKNTYSGIHGLSEKYIIGNDIKTFGEKDDSLWKEIEDRRTDSGLYGIPSKIFLLSDYLTYEPSELILISARMKMGKSALMMNEAIHKLKNGIPTIYLDTEMKDRLFYERMLANLTGIEINRIKRGQYSKEEADLLLRIRAWIKKQPFVHEYKPSFTNEKIYDICKIQKYKIGAEFVIYDYIKGNTSNSSELSNELGAKCDFLKNNVAGELDLALLSAAQLGRGDQVADSDKLERYCSANIWWRSKTDEELARDGKECGNYALNIKVNRLGEGMDETEYIDCKFDKARMRIEQADKQHVATKPFD